MSIFFKKIVTSVLLWLVGIHFFLLCGCAGISGMRRIEYSLKERKDITFTINGRGPHQFKSLEISNSSHNKIDDFWIVINEKDWSDCEGLKTAVLGMHPNPQTVHQKIMTLWSFMRRYAFHDGPPIANWKLHDGCFFFNIFGHGLCDDFAHVMEGMIVDYMKVLEQDEARCWALSGHVVPEFYYDGRWHNCDADTSYYTYKDEEALGVEDLADRFNQVIQEVHNIMPGTGVAQVYATTHNNSVIQKWRYAPHALRWTLYPGQRLLYQTENYGKYYNTANRIKPPRELSNGLLTAFPLKYFPESCYETTNLHMIDNRIKVIDPTKPGSMTVHIKTPYVLVGCTLHARTRHAERETSPLLFFSRDGSKWSVISTEREGNIVTADIGNQYDFETEYNFYNEIYMTLMIEAPCEIRDLEIQTLFQVSPRSLPELRKGENSMRIKSSSPAPLKVRLGYIERNYDLRPPSSPLYDSASNTITWSAPRRGEKPARYHIVISSDESCLWPVQPRKTEGFVASDTFSFSLSGLETFLKRGARYFVKVSSVYRIDGHNHNVPAEIESFIYKPPKKN